MAAACGTSTSAQQASKPLAIVQGQRPGGLHGTLVVNPPLTRPVGNFQDTNGARFAFAPSAPHQLTVLYFGFTHCTDVCPTTMADLATAKRLVPAREVAQLRVVFVTVDLRRDTAPVLRAWLDRFDQRFVGLRASEAVIHAAERALYADPSTIASSSPAPHRRAGGLNYQVNHTGSVYVFGPGNQSVVYTGGTRAAEYAADINRLLTIPGQ